MRSSRTLHAAFLLVVMLATAAWAQSFVAVYLGYAPVWLEGRHEPLSATPYGWHCPGADAAQCQTYRLFPRPCTSVAVLLVGAAIWLGMNNLMVGAVAGVQIDVTLVRMAMTILGFIVVENVMRNASKGELWALKHWAIGFSGVLAFQLLSRVPGISDPRSRT